MSSVVGRTPRHSRCLRTLACVVALWALLFTFVSAAVVVAQTGVESALQTYVSKPDAVYGSQVVAEQPLPGVGKLVTIRLVSQTWRESDWVHRLQVIVPDGMSKRTTPFVYITGSGSGETELPLLATLASTVKAPVAVLFDVPNQPLYANLWEDELIAFTFSQFMRTQDVTWPLLLPMAKSGVRALDAVADYVSTGLNAQVDGFVVGGASKRGWTTWLVAAVDPRVRGIAPLVYDNLNLPRQIQRQREVFPGGNSPQIQMYAALGLLDQLDTEVGRKLVNLVDPHAYRANIQMPKLIMTGTNDPYWPADALSLYYDDLAGDTFVTYIPNAGHGLGDPPRMLASMAAFHLHVTGQIRLPQPNWEVTRRPGELEIAVTAPPAVRTATLWTATAPTQDFREAQWSAAPVSGEGPTFKANARATNGQWTAAFLELSVPLGNGHAMALTSPVYMVGPVSP